MITVEHLTKTFRRRLPPDDGLFARISALFRPSYETITAVDDVSFTVPAGELLGFIGMNGAGKSTTIKCLSGILVPSAGQVEVAGLVPYRNRTQNARNIGVVFGQKSQLWWDVPARATLELLRVVWDIPLPRYRERLAELDRLLELEAFIDVPVRQLSLGQRMRADLAAALLHDPAILFLDEPTIGMDFESKDRLRTFIAQINRDHGKTVILTTHDLDDINALASRLLIIDTGRLIYEGGISTVKRQYAPYRTVTIELDASDEPVVPPPQSDVIAQERNRLQLRFPRSMTVQDIIGALSASRVRDFTVEEPHIEDVVRSIRRTLPQASASHA
jgi:ABC-2 type transport system ATP-binding protein